jgi:hypothetical protein
MQYLARGILGLSLLLGASTLSARVATAKNDHGDHEDNGNHFGAAHAVPEIATAGIAGGIALVAGGVLLVRSRRRRKAD